ncbi:unnamed protein product [Cochlearia groenlandica]
MRSKFSFEAAMEEGKSISSSSIETSSEGGVKISYEPKWYRKMIRSRAIAKKVIAAKEAKRKEETERDLVRHVSRLTLD